MPSFLNPFVDMTPERKMSVPELVGALRLDLSSELEAINTYLAHAGTTDNLLAKKVLTDIANEERVHAGELLHLIEVITGDEDKYLARGREEVDQRGHSHQI